MGEARIRIRFGDVEVEIEGEVSFVERKFNEILDRILSERKVIRGVKEVSAGAEEISFAEFVSMLPEKITDEVKILAIAYYLKKYEGKNLTYEDIPAFCEKVSWRKIHGSYARKLTSSLVRKKLLEREARGVFRILRDGEERIEELVSR
ncbi:hypothetical protein DRO02_06750 [archaeon]|nr:MAG: hypothetical protein DRN89_04030 [archaeon]RLG63369.1 MAG: hypothetical protein DRO02_06750 [archaeon]